MIFIIASIIHGETEMTADEILDQQFHKILVARHSPQNSCFADECDVLFPPLANPNFKAQRIKEYRFLSVAHPKKTCKFGWVKSAQKPFTLGEFIATQWKAEVSDEQVRLLLQLLSSIEALPDDTPVAG